MYFTRTALFCSTKVSILKPFLKQIYNGRGTFKNNKRHHGKYMEGPDDEKGSTRKKNSQEQHSSSLILSTYYRPGQTDRSNSTQLTDHFINPLLPVQYAKMLYSIRPKPTTKSIVPVAPSLRTTTMCPRLKWFCGHRAFFIPCFIIMTYMHLCMR